MVRAPGGADFKLRLSEGFWKGFSLFECLWSLSTCAAGNSGI